MTVLAWHEISERGTPTAVTPRRFAAQLDCLEDLGLRPLTLEEAPREERRGVVLTFDDGHRETYTTAFPLLAERGHTATVYVASGFVSTPGWFEPGGRAMTWSMIRELHDAGWIIGSHTVTHRRLTTLSTAALKSELDDSRAALQDQLGCPCRHFCAPYGDMDSRVLEAARESGYVTAAVTVPVRHSLGPGHGVVYRSGVYGATPWWVFRLKARGWDRILRGPEPSVSGLLHQLRLH